MSNNNNTGSSNISNLANDLNSDSPITGGGQLIHPNQQSNLNNLNQSANISTGKDGGGNSSLNQTVSHLNPS